MIEFKELQIKPEGNWILRTVKNKQIKKTLLFILIGAGVGLGFYFLTYKATQEIDMSTIIKNMFTGAMFGFFITNSPCARGKC